MSFEQSIITVAGVACITILKTIHGKPVESACDYIQLDLKTVELKLFREYESFYVIPLACGDQYPGTPVPLTIMKALKKHTFNIDPRLYDLPGFQMLRSYQKEGVEFILNRGGNGLIGDEMGIGKTFQALSIMEYYNKRTLIVCEGILQDNWVAEGKKMLGITIPKLKNPKAPFLPQMICTYGRTKLVLEAYRRETGVSKRRKIAKKLPFPLEVSQIIASYVQFSTAVEQEKDIWDLIPIKKKKLKKIITSYLTFEKIGVEDYYDVVILDESHNIKSPTSLKSKNLIKICQKAKHVIELTGTPSDKAMELYNQLKVLDPDLWKYFFVKPQYRKKNRFYFSSRYCDPQEVYTGFGVKYNHNGSERPWELNTVLRNWMIRRKTEIVLTLPEKRRNKVILGILPTPQDLDEVTRLRDAKGDSAARAEISRLVVETSYLKRQMVVDYLSEQDWSKGKVIIFVRYRPMGTAIEEFVKRIGEKYIKIDGTVATDKRYNMCELFQHDPTVNIAILSSQAAGTGINLFNAQVIYFADIDWSNKMMKQCEARAHRSGCTRPVTCNYLLANESTDTIMWRVLNKKENNSNRVLDNKRKYLQATVVTSNKKRKIYTKSEK